MNIKSFLGRAVKTAAASVLLFTSVSHAQVHQSQLFLDDGNGHITIINNANGGIGTFSFPGSGGGTILTNSGIGTVSLGGNFTTSGGAYSLQFNLTNNTTLTLPTSGTLLANPFLNIGDIMYASATGTPGTVAVLPIGGPGQVLEVSGSNTPEWATVTGTGSVTSVDMSVPSFLTVTGNPITSAGTLAVDYSGSALPVANGGTGLTTINTGDILYGSASNTLSALPISATMGQVLTVSAGGLPEWDNAPTGFANPMTNTGDMIYSSDNTGTPAALPIGVGTTGYVLTVGVSGLPEWDELNGGSGVVTSVSNTDGSLSISPTTGAVVAQINPAFSNAWSATQSFPTTDAQGSAIDASINAATTTLINGTKISGNISGNAGGLSSTLAVASGGTGQSSALTQYGVVYGSTTSAMSTTLAGTANTVLHGNASGAPTWSPVDLTNDVTNTLPVTDITATGTASNTTYLRGDGAWSTIPAGFSNPMTTNGDIIYQSGGVPTELHSTNTVGQVLTVSSTNGGLAWQGVVNSIVGSANEVLVSGGSGSDVSGAGIVLSLPQPVSANASPTFQALTLGDATHAGIIALSNTGTPTYTSLEASASGVAQTYTLPPGYPISANEMLVSTTTGGMSWAPQNAGTVTAIGVTTANGVSGSSSGGATPSLTITLGAITPSSVVSAGAVSGTTVTATTAASGMTIGSGVNATNLSSASTVAAKNINFPNASGNLALVTGTNGAIAESDVTGLTTDLASKGSGTVTGSSFATDGVMYATGSTGIASTAALTSGQLLVGSTGAPPAPATLGTSNGVSATTGAGTLSIGLGAITPTSVSTSGNISTTGSGTITSAGLLTASNGLTVTGTVTLPTTSIANAALQGSGDITIQGTAVALGGSALATTSTPTFADLTLSNATNQLILGTTRTATISAPEPGTASRIYTIPDPGAAANFIMSTMASTQSIAGGLTSSGLLTGSAGLTVTGATVSLNASSNFATTINTGSSTGAVTIGNTANTVAITSGTGASAWGVTNAGIATFEGFSLGGTASVAVGDGGTGTTTPPLGTPQILISQSTSAYAPETVSGDIAITAAGVTSFGASADNDIMAAANAGTGVLDVNNGGTGQATAAAAFNALNPMTTTGDIIYESGTGVASRLAKGANGNTLMINGTGNVSWGTPTSTTMPTGTTDGIAYYSGTAYALTSVGTAGQVLTSDGGSGAPTWSNMGAAQTATGAGGTTTAGTGVYTSTFSGAGASLTLSSATTTKAIVIVTARIAPTGTSDYGDVSFEISGTTTLAASDANAVFNQAYGGTSTPSISQGSTMTFVTLTAGSGNLFTIEAKDDGSGQTAFSNLTLTVIPLN